MELLYWVPQVRYREWKGELGTGMCGVENEGGSEPVSIPRYIIFKGKVEGGVGFIADCFVCF